MKKQMKPILPILLVVALIFTVGCGIGTTYSKYHFSKDISNISLTVIPSNDVDAAQLNLDVSNARNMTVQKVDVGTTFETDGDQFLALQFTPDDGYTLPDTIEIVIGEEYYVVSTVQVEDNVDEFEWNSEDNLLIISSTIIPVEGCTIFVYAEAVLVLEKTESENTGATEPEETDSEEMEETEPVETELVENDPEETEETEPEEPETEETATADLQEPESEGTETGANT